MSSPTEVSSESTIEGDGGHEYYSQTPDSNQADGVVCTRIPSASLAPSESGIESHAGGVIGHSTSAKQGALPSFAQLLSYVFPNKSQLERDGLAFTTAHSCEQCNTPSKRYYLLNIESPISPHTSDLIISIDPQDLTQIQWLAIHFTEDIRQIYPPPPSSKGSHLSIGIRDPAYPEGHFCEISPSTYLSLLMSEPYNPAVRSGNIYCHIPKFSVGQGGNSIKVLYTEAPSVPEGNSANSEYSTSPVSQASTPSSSQTSTLSASRTPSRTPPSLQVPGELPNNCLCIGMGQCTPATTSPPQPIMPNYVALITVQFMPSDPREQIRVFRPPLELDVEQDGNFYTLQATVEETLRNANAMMDMGPLSELVGKNAIFVYLAYNKFIIPGHFAWNKSTFAEFDPELRGGTLKMHLTAWVLEHPLADPSGAPTGLPSEHLQSQSGRDDWVPYPPQETGGGEETHRSGYARKNEKGKERKSDSSYTVGVQHRCTLPQIGSNEYSGDSRERSKIYHTCRKFGDVPTAGGGSGSPVALHSKETTLEDERAQGYFLESRKGRALSHSNIPLEACDGGAEGGSKKRRMVHNKSRPMDHTPEPHNEAEQEPCPATGTRLPKKARCSVPAGPTTKRRRRR